METERSSEIQFVATKDAFLYMTIFASIKTIYSLRISCKKINQWLSDPTTVSWKLRIQNTFPHSYEDVLKQTMDDQIRRLLKFDSLVEEGLSVSCLNLNQLSQTAVNKKVSGLTRLIQLPWQKNIFILKRYEGLCLYDANTASVGETADLGLTYPFSYQRLLNISDRKIGIISNMELKLYRHEGTKLILDQQMVLNHDRSYSAASIFGDCILFKNGSGAYRVHSISTNSIVFELNLHCEDCCEVFSELAPLVYVVYRQPFANFLIKEINFLTRQSKEFPVVTQSHRPFDVTEIHLIENERERYLKIYSTLSSFGVQVYDIQQQRLIFNQYYGRSEKQYEYNCDFWNSLKYNPELRYYCTSYKGDITIKESKASIYSQDDQEVFSRRFEHSSIQMHTIKWLSNDILSVCLKSHVADSYINSLRGVFMSATKQKVIGFITGDMTVFSDGDRAIAFDLNTENVYSINFATAYDQDTNLKRKLEDSDDQSERKKQKLSNS